MSGELELQESGKRALDEESRNLSVCLGFPTVSWWLAGEILAPKDPLLAWVVHILGLELARVRGSVMGKTRQRRAGGGQARLFICESLTKANITMTSCSLNVLPFNSVS